MRSMPIEKKPSPWLDAVNIPLAIAASVFTAFVLSQLWLWFVVPLGLPAIGMAQALGLAIVASILAGAPTAAIQRSTRERKGYEYLALLASENGLALPNAEAKEETSRDRLITVLAIALVVLGTWGSGAIFTLFM